MATPRSFRRGLVFLYAISVFTVIAAIGLTILESGDNFVDLAQTDIYSIAAQQAALSGIAYGEAMIYRMLHLRDTTLNDIDDLAGKPNFPQGTGNPSGPPIPMPWWAGARPPGGTPYGYVALQGWDWDALSANNNSARYTFCHETIPGVTPATPRLLAQFRIELRECSIPAPATPGCLANLFDENLRRNGLFWPDGSSSNKPNQPVLTPGPFQITPVEDTAFMYTMRVEGLAIRRNPDGTQSFMSHCIMKEVFSFTQGTRPSYEMQLHAFWNHSLQRGY